MKATEFKTIAKDAASNQLAQAFAAAKSESEPAFNPQRRAYQGETLLSANRSVSCDTWRSGLNNNVLVLGSSGGGKTRNHVKPNLLQCQGSYIVLDCKGSLYHEMGPYLEGKIDYIVDCIDFNAMDGTIGYNPLDHIRWCEGRPMQQDIISIASAICPVDEHASDSFWPLAAANYLTAYIAYVLEALPDEAQNMSSVIRMFELAVARAVDPLFTDLQKEDPKLTRPRCTTVRRPRAVRRRCMRASWESSRPTLCRSGSKVSSGRTAILGRSISAALGAKSARCSSPSTTWTEASTSLRVSSSSKRFPPCAARLIAITPITGSRCRSASCSMTFANLRLPHIDDVLSVIRSREISCTVVCQTISQLEARYGEATANSIVGNCDSQLVLGFQDERTAAYFSCRANKTASTLLETPAGMWWVFLRGQRGAMDPARRLEDHPRYPEIIEAKRTKEARIKLEEQRRREEEDRMLREIEEELNVSLEELEMEDFDERNIA